MSQATRVKCRLLWKLARRHGWGSPVAETTLVTDALEPSAQGRGRELLADLRREPFVGVRRGDEFVLSNDPDSQALAAVRLRETCGYSRLQVEATLSRFEQAGGFEAYDADALRDELDSWS